MIDPPKFTILDYEKDDIFKELKVNDADKTSAIFTLSNPLGKNLSKESLKINFNDLRKERLI